MSTPDERPRPQYGEYATPEEQRAQIQVPLDRNVEEPVPIAAGRDSHPNQHSHEQIPATEHPRTPGRNADRVATIALIGIGLINVVTTVPGLFDLSAVMNEAFKFAGLSGYSGTSLTGQIGIALVVVYAVGWLASTWFSVMSLRAHRVSFWIPLVAGVVVTIIATACFLVLATGDSSFMEYIQTQATT